MLLKCAVVPHKHCLEWLQSALVTAVPSVSRFISFVLWIFCLPLGIVCLFGPWF